MKLSGIYAPITTPFDKSGDLDVAGAAANSCALVKAGIGGHRGGGLDG